MTAWNIPIKVIKKLSLNFPKTIFTVASFSESTGRLLKFYIYNGIITYDDREKETDKELYTELMTYPINNE